MSDIRVQIERLRKIWVPCPSCKKKADEAADTLERLANALEEYANPKNWERSCGEAIFMPGSYEGGGGEKIARKALT